MWLGDQCGARRVGCRPIGFRRQYGDDDPFSARHFVDVCWATEENIERPEPPTVQFLVVDTSVCQFQQNVAELHPVN